MQPGRRALFLVISAVHWNLWFVSHFGHLKQLVFLSFRRFKQINLLFLKYRNLDLIKQLSMLAKIKILVIHNLLNFYSFDFQRLHVLLNLMHNRVLNIQPIHIEVFSPLLSIVATGVFELDVVLGLDICNLCLRLFYVLRYFCGVGYLLFLSLRV